MKMFKCSAKTKVEFFDDAGEIQIVPIDTVVDDGSINPGADMDSSRRNQSQGFGARDSRDKGTSRCCIPQWREPDIVA